MNDVVGIVVGVEVDVEPCAWCDQCGGAATKAKGHVAVMIKEINQPCGVMKNRLRHKVCGRQVR
jgi:hypothetical protein